MGSLKQRLFLQDEDTIDYFRSLAGQSGIPYQSLINLYLRDCVAEKKKLRLEWVSQKKMTTARGLRGTADRVPGPPKQP